jgi:putative nucleotidyltransferase with HDIG domain
MGGDEFAVILPGVRAWGALEFVNRLRATLAARGDEVRCSASAGISEALELRDKDELVREADLALITTKRQHHGVGVYKPDLELIASTPAGEDHETRTLANALALAVDAKDSYTRSHCQTVSELAAMIAGQLGFEGAHLARMRLAGLLHDVGKIGVPDAILNKPAKLTDGEYEEMKAHSQLGHDIVSAADLPGEALWVRHHHERYDGNGYPEGMGGEGIPLESRIILVADAFEAMTSDRPYRKAPGREFALGELRRNAGTQFDPRVVDALCAVLEAPRSDAEGDAPVPDPVGTPA